MSKSPGGNASSSSKARGSPGCGFQDFHLGPCSSDGVSTSRRRGALRCHDVDDSEVVHQSKRAAISQPALDSDDGSAFEGSKTLRKSAAAAKSAQKRRRAASSSEDSSGEYVPSDQDADKEEDEAEEEDAEVEADQEARTKQVAAASSPQSPRSHTEQ
jgi:hypothetical protein